MQDRVPRQAIALLLGYPLIATAIALDAVWALLHRDWWPPAVYTLAAASITCALAACSEHLLPARPSPSSSTRATCPHLIPPTPRRSPTTRRPCRYRTSLSRP